MIGIYLAAYTALHPDYNIVYQDINGKRDLDGDMMDIDINLYDFVIASPPCNYWSKARGTRLSDYSINTKHLLIDILAKLRNYNKPWIIENVRNDKRFREYNLIDLDDVFIYRVGRHTYWTNIMFNTWCDQYYEFKYVNGHCTDLFKRSERQGSKNVHVVIERWLKEIHSCNYIKI